MGTLMRTIAPAVACVITIISTAAIAAPFDGDWSFFVKTADHCGNSQWSFRIIDGEVHNSRPMFVSVFPARVSGKALPSGAITIHIAAGPRFATGTGRLGKRQGSGTWDGQGPSGTCAGIWTAIRLN